MRLRGKWVAAIAVVVLAVVAGAVAILVPVPHPYSGQSTTRNDGSNQFYGGSQQTFHHDSTVTVNWKTTGGETVFFTVVAVSDRTILACPTVNGSSGSCSFTADQITYDYFVHDWPNLTSVGNVTVTYSGTYSNPLIEG